jgi:hypothetical protein
MKSFFQDLDFIESNSLPGQVFRKFPDFATFFRQQTGNTIYSFAPRLSGGTPVARPFIGITGQACVYVKF